MGIVESIQFRQHIFSLTYNFAQQETFFFHMMKIYVDLSMSYFYCAEFIKH